MVARQFRDFLSSAGLEEVPTEGAAATVSNIAAELREFAGQSAQHDDITLISIRRL